MTGLELLLASFSQFWDTWVIIGVVLIIFGFIVYMHKEKL